MRYFIFVRKSNVFDDILEDLKERIELKLYWSDHLLIRVSNEFTDTLSSYIHIKYGDELEELAVLDFTPKPEIDYIPIYPNVNTKNADK